MSVLQTKIRKKTKNMKILHAFVGSCVESEELKKHGDVIGMGIKPTFHSKKNVDNWIQTDLMETFPLDTTFDFGLFHPMCKKWSTAKNINPNEYENQIPRAKELAQKYCNNWVIENIRNSPIGFSPDLRLKGDMFNLPIKYERCFWMNYDIPQPEIIEQNKYRYNIQRMNKEQAEKAKKYSGYYYAHDIIKNSLPKPYVKYLLHPLVDCYSLEELI